MTVWGNRKQIGNESLSGEPADIAQAIVARLVAETEGLQGRKAVAISTSLNWDEQELAKEKTAELVAHIGRLAVQCGLEFDIEFRDGRHLTITAFVS
jgi:hypothetical protein